MNLFYFCHLRFFSSDYFLFDFSSRLETNYIFFQLIRNSLGTCHKFLIVGSNQNRIYGMIALGTKAQPS